MKFATMDQQALNTMNKAMEKIETHVHVQNVNESKGLVEKWKSEKVYPFEKDPETPIEKVVRRVFDVVALHVNKYLPDFQESETNNKRLQMRLIRHAIENSPSDLTRILFEEINLPKSKKKELSELLEKTAFANIISASKLIADRLEFLKGLESIIFDPGIRSKTKECGQLHRILADNAWIFGEQYNLSVDDSSLTQVLRKHIQSSDIEIDLYSPVYRDGGKKGIVDLIFSRSIQLAGKTQREHLIVELKRPNSKINVDASNQIESFAQSVATDERFKSVPTDWKFWLVSNDIDDKVKFKIGQAERAYGELMRINNPSITIWIKTWSEIINECRSRLLFYSEKLNYDPDQEKSFDHMSKVYHNYLSELIPEKYTR